MPSSASTSTLADYLATGYWREEGGFPHRFSMAAGAISVDLSSLDASGRALARAALQAWTMVADLSFREVAGGADITFDDGRSGASTSVSMLTSGVTVEAGVNVGTSWLDTYGDGLGSYSFQTYLHEIGHALGLGHAGHYNGGADYGSDAKFANDCWQQTVMSYFNQVENTDVDASYATVVTPMMADVLAIQKLYGAAEGGPTAGDTTYGVGADTGTYLDAVFAGGNGSLAKNALTIWDADGTDTIDLRDDGTDQRISLEGGAVSDVHGLKGNLAIAPGTTIEDFVAGRGDDEVGGNGAGNRIWGGDGDDRLDAGGGDDRLYGDDGEDRLLGGTGHDHLNGGQGKDELHGEGGKDRLYGFEDDDRLDAGGNDDKLHGGSGDDRLHGGRGADRLDGGSGDDRLAGGSGDDTFVFNGGRDVITYLNNDDETLKLDSGLWDGRRLARAEVLDFARMNDGDVLFDFGGGDTLRIEGFKSVGALANDLAFV